VSITRPCVHAEKSEWQEPFPTLRHPAHQYSCQIFPLTNYQQITALFLNTFRSQTTYKDNISFITGTNSFNGTYCIQKLRLRLPEIPYPISRIQLIHIMHQCTKNASGI